MATDELSVTQAETAIRQFRDVGGVVAGRGLSGLLDKTRVLAPSNRLPNEVARDTKPALQTRLGQVLDHRKISVGQIQAAILLTPARLELDSVSVSRMRVIDEASVRWPRQVQDLAKTPARIRKIIRRWILDKHLSLTKNENTHIHRLNPDCVVQHKLRNHNVAGGAGCMGSSERLYDCNDAAKQIACQNLQSGRSIWFC